MKQAVSAACEHLFPALAPPSSPPHSCSSLDLAHSTALYTPPFALNSFQCAQCSCLYSSVLFLLSIAWLSCMFSFPSRGVHACMPLLLVLTCLHVPMLFYPSSSSCTTNSTDLLIVPISLNLAALLAFLFVVRFLFSEKSLNAFPYPLLSFSSSFQFLLCGLFPILVSSFPFLLPFVLAMFS